MITLWHNPRCSKSRAALKILTEAGAEFKEYRYLDTAPSVDDLRDLIGKLGIAPFDLLRKGEKTALELGLNADMPDADLIAAMAANPILIERPIAVTEDEAIIGRPPENIAPLL